MSIVQSSPSISMIDRRELGESMMINKKEKEEKEKEKERLVSVVNVN